MKTNHIVISGTGRAGTTFLVQLLSALGFDTGFRPDSQINTIANAGLEIDLRKNKKHYIVKDPHFCDYATEIYKNQDITIDYLIVPVRNLKDAALSRIKNVQQYSHMRPDKVVGGLFGTTDDSMQEYVLAEKFYNLVYNSLAYDIPILFLKYPDIVQLPYYLYYKLLQIPSFTKKLKNLNNFISIYKQINQRYE